MNPLQTIEIRGERVELLLTPSLHSVATRKGWEIKTTEDWAQIQSAYIKLFFCAMINAYEVNELDGKEQKPFSYTLLDLECWAMEHPKELGELIKTYIFLRYGKSLEQIAKDNEKNQNKADENKEAEKKKNHSLWSKTMGRLKSFFAVRD